MTMTIEVAILEDYEIEIEVEAEVVGTGGDPYTGAYEVTPRLTEQTLETQYKVMMDDVLVRGIPITETSNPYGGKTVLIG